MKNESLVSKISRFMFGCALLAIVTAALFSLLRKNGIAEQAGVVTYIFLVMGVLCLFIDELTAKQVEHKVNSSTKKKKKNSRRHAI